MVLDGAKEQNNQHRDILTKEMETMGVRLNQEPPGIYFKKKATGGMKFNATCALTKLGEYLFIYTIVDVLIHTYTHTRIYIHIHTPQTYTRTYTTYTQTYTHTY